MHAVARFIETHGDDPIARHQPWRGASHEPPRTRSHHPERPLAFRQTTNTTAQGTSCQQDLAAPGARITLKETASFAELNGVSSNLRVSCEMPRAAGRRYRRDEAQGGDVAPGEVRKREANAARPSSGCAPPTSRKTPQDRGRWPEGGAAGGPQGQVPRPTRHIVRRRATHPDAPDRRRDSNRRRPRASLGARRVVNIATSTPTTPTTRPNPRTASAVRTDVDAASEHCRFSLKRSIRQIHRRRLRAAAGPARLRTPTRRRAVQPARNVPHHPNLATQLGRRSHERRRPQPVNERNRRALTAPWATLRRRWTRSKSPTRGSPSSPRRRGGSVNTTAEAARRVRDPGGTDRRDRPRRWGEQNGSRSPTRGSPDENAPPMPPIWAASSKGPRSPSTTRTRGGPRRSSRSPCRCRRRRRPRTFRADVLRLGRRRRHYRR